MKIARDITVNTHTGEIRMEGIKFPFHIAEEPEVIPASPDYPVNRLVIEVLADKVVVVGSDHTRQRFDEKGELNAWIKATVDNLVEETLGDTLRWLEATS